MNAHLTGDGNLAGRDGLPPVLNEPPRRPSGPIAEGENLSRFYGMILGLNNVSFAIRPGITGVVGPNGAGKTTLFRLLLGQIRPSSGEIRVMGERPWNNPMVQARIAYCPEAETVPTACSPGASRRLTSSAVSGFAILGNRAPHKSKDDGRNNRTHRVRIPCLHRTSLTNRAISAPQPAHHKNRD